MALTLIKHVKLLWISIGIAWILTTFFIVLYLELFHGMNGPITQISTSYNINQRDKNIDYIINHWDSNQSVLPSQLQNIESFKFLIGIGCIKCGSTYFHALIRKQTRFWERNNIHSKYHFVFKVQEAHYFDKCINCTFSAYINHLIASQRGDPLQYRPTNKMWVFGEKTVTYFDNYNSAHLLSFYARKFDIFFYIVLRNPVRQLWSHLWMRREGCSPTNYVRLQCIFIRDELYYLQRDKVKDIHKMADYLNDFLLHRIQNELPIFYEIMNGIKINQDGGRGLDEMRVIELLKQRTFDILHYYSHVFVSSCHYCLVLLWFYEWNAMNGGGHSGNRFEDRFRIIQSEQIFESAIVSNEFVQRLLCWMIGNEMNLNKCERMGMIKNKGVRMKGEKYRQYAPDILDVMELNVSNTIKEFYNDSMKRLIWFIEEHANIMIGHTKFLAYW